MSATSDLPFVAPVPTGLPKGKVDELGAKVAAKVGYVPGEDLEPIVKSLGGKIRYQSWIEATDGGSLEVYPEAAGTEDDPRFAIRISPNVGNLRNRFTVAHELGHYFLHSDVGQRRIQVNRGFASGDDGLEWEANWFAAGFLMPAQQFQEDWASTGGNVGRLINLYQVSEPVIEIRKKYLGLV